jgi:hypothetical protein
MLWLLISYVLLSVAQSVGIVRLRTQAMKFILEFYMLLSVEPGYQSLYTTDFETVSCDCPGGYNLL